MMNSEEISNSALTARLLGFADRVRRSAHTGELAKILKVLFLACLFIILFSFIYGNPSDQPVPFVSFRHTRLLTLIAIRMLLVLCLVVGLLEGRKFSFWLVAIISLIITLHISDRAGAGNTLITVYALVFAFPRSLRMEKVALVAFIAMLLAISCIVISCLVGHIPNYSGMRGNRLRVSMGFRVVNSFAVYTTAAFIPYVFFRLKRWRWFDTVFCLVAGTLVFALSDGRMSYAILVLMVLFACLCKYKRFQDFLLGAAPWAIIVCFIAVLMFTLIYHFNSDQMICKALDAFFSGRLSYISSYYDECSLKWFGQELDLVNIKDVVSGRTREWRGIDCAYVYILLRFGIIGSAILALSSIWMGLRIRDQKSVAAALVVVTVALFSITENCLYYPALNFGIYILGFYVSQWANESNESLDSCRVNAV